MSEMSVTQMKLSEKHTHIAKSSTLYPYLTNSFVTYSSASKITMANSRIHAVGVRTPC